MLTPCPSPGIYPGVTFDEYRSWEAVNNSSLGPALRSASSYAAYINDESRSSGAMMLGTLVHGGKLEPLNLLQHYVLLPDFTEEVKNADGSKPAKPKLTKQYREKVAAFRAANSDKEVIEDASMYSKMLGIVQSLSANERAREYLCNQGDVELSMVWIDTETGLPCKGRIDHWNRNAGRITDLKTTRDVLQFGKAIANFGYDRQAAFYIDGMRSLGLQVNEFCIVAVENESAPYGVRSAPIGQDTIDDGRRLYREALQVIADYKASGVAKGFDDPDTWEKPSWAFPKQESLNLTFNGVPIGV